MEQLSDRILSRRWGVFNHFLYGNPGSEMPTGKDLSDWNAQVENFDVERVAHDLHEIGAGWYFITVMQGRKYMLAPNATFDRIAGTKPGEACAKRDLISDLYDALKKYDIDLYLYYTGDGPYKDVEILVISMLTSSALTTVYSPFGMRDFGSSVWKASPG